MDLQQSGGGANGDDDSVEYNCGPSQPHMQTAVAFRHEAALQQEKDHPAGHESTVNINERGSLLCYWLSCIVQAVHVKLTKTDAYARNHHQADDQVEEALSMLRLSHLGACGSGGNG